MGCVFCEKKGIENGLIAETKNFMVFPSIGQIVEGYTLIVPKDHIKCFGAMPKDLLGEYTELKQKVDAATTAVYQKPMYFEHGIVGQTVYHAHMHCVPTGADIYYSLLGFRHRRINSEHELPEVFNDYGAYLFYEQKGQFAFNATGHLDYYPLGLYSMILRIALAEALGTPAAANWRNVNREKDEESMQKTVEKLRPFFK
ncbi:MAG TPA: HIT family protein [Nanoarchaeota archaeon]|nr:HIT family protein [Nanoarchaeota archaeon]